MHLKGDSCYKGVVLFTTQPLYVKHIYQNAEHFAILTTRINVAINSASPSLAHCGSLPLNLLQFICKKNKLHLQSLKKWAVKLSEKIMSGVFSIESSRILEWLNSFGMKYKIANFVRESRLAYNWNEMYL